MNGTKLRLSPPGGGMDIDVPLDADVPNGDSQRSILIGKAVDGITPNFDRTLNLEGAGGKVCFLGTSNEVIDCASWGSFGTSPDAGSPAATIPANQSIERAISGGTCATALDNGDDTDNSATDFVTNAMPTGTPNSATPTETLCPGGGGGGGDPDTAPPVTKIDRPKQGRTYAPAKLRTLRGTASDNSGSVVEVELALRKKMVSGACRWWNGSGFVKRACSARLLFDAAGQGSWTYHLPSKLASSVGTKVASYTLYARSRDVAGNLEPLFTKGRNANRFEIKAPA